MLGLSTPFEQAKNWLISSGLAVIDKENENCGAVHAYYDNKNKKYGFLYPEITGYYISTLRFLYQYEKNEKYLELAKLSADWLIQIYKKYHGIIMNHDFQKTEPQLAFSFDTAICAKGLIDCYLLVNDKKYLEYGEKMVKWITEKAMTEDGMIMPFQNLGSNEFRESNDVWYKQKGCFHIKIAIPILQLYDLTKNSNLLDKAIRICNTYTRFQNKDGSFFIHENSSTVNLHTQCYALEGLLYGYIITQDEAYLQSCEKALKWSAQKIEADGSISLWFGSKYKSKASYAVAQLMRLMILLDSLHKKRDYKNHIDNLHSFLLTLQANSNDPKVYGAFYEEFYKSILGWKIRQKLNSWGSMFALESLKWYETYDNLDFNHSVEYIY